MKQLGLRLNLLTKKTRKREFLEEMERVVRLVNDILLAKGLMLRTGTAVDATLAERENAFQDHVFKGISDWASELTMVWPSFPECRCDRTEHCLLKSR